MSYKDGKSKLYKKTAKSPPKPVRELFSKKKAKVKAKPVEKVKPSGSKLIEMPIADRRRSRRKLELKNSIGDLNLQIKSMKNDMLKMIEAIEKNEMHITQLNWKLNNHTGKSYDEELDQ